MNVATVTTPRHYQCHCQCRVPKCLLLTTTTCRAARSRFDPILHFDSLQKKKVSVSSSQNSTAEDTSKEKERQQVPGAESTTDNCSRCSVSRGPSHSTAHPQLARADQVNLQLLSFRVHLAEADLDGALRSYPQLLRDKLLETRDTVGLAQLLHYRYRTEKDGSKREALRSHVESFQRDFMNRALPPHPSASLHLISYFKESKNYDNGIRFWNWVIEQDDNYINIGTYGAAIELLTYYGKDLDYCEEVYTHALTRFAVQFNEYHLSPGAILPDRAQHMVTSGTSMQLLQGILTARLLHRDWRNAYLALDTALRIHPSQIPSFFFQLFHRERPLQEAYQVFCLACRAGNVIPGSSLTTLLQELHTAVQNVKDDQLKEDIVGAMFNAVHAFIGSAGRLEAPHMNVLLKGILTILYPTEQTESTQAPVHQEKMSKTVSSVFEQLLEVFGALGVVPEPSTFNTLIQVSARLKHRGLITLAMRAFEDTGVSPDANTFRSLQTAAARLQDPAMLKSSWTEFVRFVTAQGSEPDSEDWTAFARVAKRAGMSYVVFELMPSFPQDTKLGAKMLIPETQQDLAPKSLDSDVDIHVQERIQSFEQVSAEIELLRKRVNFHQFHNLKAAPINRASITSWMTNVDEDWQRRLYDELTLDLAAPTVPPLDGLRELEKKPPAESATGLPLDELRYLNWKSINDLLMQAEPFEARREQLVEEAIAEGKSAQKSKTSWSKTLSGKTSKYGSGTLQADLEYIKAACTHRFTESEWREKILSLRGTGHRS